MSVGVGIADFGANFIQYMPNVRYTMRKKSLMRNIGLRDIPWEGEKLVQKLHVGYNFAIADVEDGGSIPAADKQTYIETEVARKNTVGAVQLTDGIMGNAKGKGAAIKVTQSELTGMTEAMRWREGFMMLLDGTGVITTLGSTVSGSTITVADARMLRRGVQCEIRDATTPTTVHTQFKVASVARSYSSGVATVTPDATISAAGQAQGDYLVWQVGDHSSYNRSVTGLDALIDDTASGTFQGVTMSSYPHWTSAVYNGGGSTQNLSTNLLRNVLATLKQEDEQFGDPGTGMLCLTEVWTAVKFEELFERALRVTPTTSKVGIPGGVTFDTAFGRVTVKAMPEVQYGYMYFVNRSAIARPVQKKLDWRPGGIGGIFNRSDSFLGYTATCLETCDFMIFERNTCAKITNLSVNPQTAY